MKASRIRGLLAAGLLAGSVAANAAPVIWTLNGVTFDDGSTASGSFVFDASTSTFSNVLITTSTSGTTYTTNEVSPVPFGANASGLELVDNFVPNANVGKPILNLDFLSVLTDAGGVIGVVPGFPSFEGFCTSADCGSGTFSRQVTAGTVVGVAVVPEPATFALLGLGLAGLAAARRRKH